MSDTWTLGKQLEDVKEDIKDLSIKQMAGDVRLSIR